MVMEAGEGAGAGVEAGAGEVLRRRDYLSSVSGLLFSSSDRAQATNSVNSCSLVTSGSGVSRVPQLGLNAISASLTVEKLGTSNQEFPLYSSYLEP